MRASSLSVQSQRALSSSQTPRLGARGRSRSQLTPVAEASSVRAVIGVVVPTSDRRRDRLVGVAMRGTSTSTTSSPSTPPLSRAKGPTRFTSSSASSIAAAAASTSGGSESNVELSTPPSLVLYSKQNCPLCQGLEEKVRAALARGTFLPDSKLRGIKLKIRDIESNERWNATFAMEVPVLFWEKRKRGGAEGAEEKETPIPRSPPRVTVEKLSKTLEAAMPLD